jgi:hypothetical protein
MCPSREHRKISASYKKWWKNLESYLSKLIYLIQTRNPRRPMIIATVLLMGSALAILNVSGDFIVPRVNPLQGQKGAYLQSLHTSQRLSLWPALQGGVPLLPFPLMRMQSMPSRASPPALTITVSSIKAQKTLPSIYKDLAILPISENLPTIASTTWSHHFHSMPTTTVGRGYRNLFSETVVIPFTT